MTAPSTPLATTAAAVAPARDPRMDELIGEISELKKSFRSLSKAMPRENCNSAAACMRNCSARASMPILPTTSFRQLPGENSANGNAERVRQLLGDQLVIAQPAELLAKTADGQRFRQVRQAWGKQRRSRKSRDMPSFRMKKKVALISTDMFRIGGQEQLVRFGELLGVPTYGCADLATLKEMIASLDDRDLILIDTAGSSPSDLARLSKLENLTESGAKVHLVISATTRSDDISKVVSRFQRFTPSSVIFTKIDETDSKGSLAGDLLRNELAVSYLTTDSACRKTC